MGKDILMMLHGTGSPIVTRVTFEI